MQHVNATLAPSAGRLWYTSLLVSFSVGVVIAYAANHNMSLHIKSTRRLINTNIRDLKTFANNTPSVRQGVQGTVQQDLRDKKNALMWSVCF